MQKIFICVQAVAALNMSDYIIGGRQSKKKVFVPVQVAFYLSL